jgi:type IV secretion system protein VirD4
MYKLTRQLLILAVGIFALSGGVLATLLAPWSFAFLFVGVVILLAKRRREFLSAFGTAQWATPAELRQAGMLGGDTGLIIGRCDENAKPKWFPALKTLLDRRVPHAEACNAIMAVALKHWKVKPKAPLVRLPKAVHTAVFAPTGCGKGASFVVPQLLSCPDSVVCVDFKGELSSITAEHRRRKFGHRIVLLDPFKVVTSKPDSFNPLDFIDKDNPEALDDVRSLAEAMVIRTGQEKDPHFADMSEVWIAALIAGTVQYGTPGNRSLQTVRTLLSDPAKIEGFIKLLCSSDAWGGMLARLGGTISNSKDKELASTLTTTSRFMRFLDTLAVAQSTSSSTFDPADLRKVKMTIYLVLPPDHLRTQSPLLRLAISSFLRAIVRGGLGEQNKVHFILDEAASLGKMDAISDALDKFRGYGVRLQFYYQSVGQLKTCWPDGQDQTLLSNVTQVFFAVNDNETAKYVSERLGKETIIVKSGGTNSGRSRSWQETGKDGSSSRNYGSNDNWQQSGRELLKPEEVMALDQRDCITFTPGMRPIYTRLVRYYEEAPDTFLTRRASELKTTIFGFGFLAYACLLLALTFAMKHMVEEKRNERSGTGVFRTGQEWRGDNAAPGGQGGTEGVR